MATVSQAKVDKLKARIKKDIPNFEIFYKEDDDWYRQTWYLWLIWAFFRVVGVFSSSMRDDFDQNYSNGVYSKMVFTTRERNGDWTNPRTFRLVVHEYRHMLDMKKRPLWMPISYLIVLPTVFTMRAYWELRGYTAGMLAHYEIYGTIPDALMETKISHFTSSMYFWMFPFPRLVRRAFEKRRKAIYDGEITLGMDW